MLNKCLFNILYVVINTDLIVPLAHHLICFYFFLLFQISTNVA